MERNFQIRLIRLLATILVLATVQPALADDEFGGLKMGVLPLDRELELSPRSDSPAAVPEEARTEAIASPEVVPEVSAAELPSAPAASTAPPAVTRTPGQGYRIAPEDVLEISVWHEEGLKKELLVRPDGGISFPLVGDVQASGKTAEDVCSEITDRLRKSINDPVVSVSVLKAGGNKIYVIGRVTRPGEYVAGRYVDVLQALAMAGGLTPYAAEDDIKVLRKHDGVDETFSFTYSDVRRGKRLDQNITLQSGDVIVVP